MQSHAKFYFFSEIYTKTFFWLTDTVINHLLVPHLIVNKIFLRFSEYLNKLLSTTKIIIFRADSLPNLHEPAPPNTIFDCVSC